ncbi:hypothetical protein DRJ16_02520 [Candidatus Woesearchaeota archaeon]|nr:MAG: hypothetical protein DRJ16_02520 [Candidatus Woesearchaeota archaeon]
MIEWILNEDQLKGKALEEKLQKIEHLFGKGSNEQTSSNKIFCVEIDGEVVHEEKGDPLQYMRPYLAKVLQEYHQTTGEDPRSKFPYLSSAVGYKKAQ